MKAIFVGTNREPFVIEFEGKLEHYQALVEGRIEKITISENEKTMRSIDLMFNEEFLFLFETINRTLIFENGYAIGIRGNILCLAADESTGEYVDLTDEEIKHYISFLKNDKLTITNI